MSDGGRRSADDWWGSKGPPDEYLIMREEDVLAILE